MRAKWLGMVATAGIALTVLAVWPYVRPAFSGGVSAAAGLLERTEPYGALVVVGLQMLQAVISPLPSWPVTVAAGALYGPWLGTIYSLIGGMLGAAINFGLARHYGQPLVERTLGKKWVARAANLGPLHFLVLALMGRLIPVASFDLVAYVAGISRLGWSSFLAVAAVGQAPAIFAYAYFGSDLSRAQSSGLFGSLVLLVLVALLVVGRRLWERMTAS